MKQYFLNLVSPKDPAWRPKLLLGTILNMIDLHNKNKNYGPFIACCDYVWDRWLDDWCWFLDPLEAPADATEEMQDLISRVNLLYQPTVTLRERILEISGVSVLVEARVDGYDFHLVNYPSSVVIARSTECSSEEA